MKPDQVTRVVLSFNDEGVVQLHTIKDNQELARRLLDGSLNIPTRRIFFDTQEAIEGKRETEAYDFREEDFQSPGAFLSRWTNRKDGLPFSDEEVTNILNPIKGYGGILFVLNGEFPHLDHTFQHELYDVFDMKGESPNFLSYRGIFLYRCLYRCLANNEYDDDVRELFGRMVAASFQDELFYHLGSFSTGFSTAVLQRDIANVVTYRFEQYEAARLKFGNLEHFEEFFDFEEIRDLLYRLQQASEDAIVVHITPSKEDIASWNTVHLAGIANPGCEQILRHAGSVIAREITRSEKSHENEEYVLTSLYSLCMGEEDKKTMKLLLEVAHREKELQEIARNGVSEIFEDVV